MVRLQTPLLFCCLSISIASELAVVYKTDCFFWGAVLGSGDVLLSGAVLERGFGVQQKKIKVYSWRVKYFWQFSRIWGWKAKPEVSGLLFEFTS